MSYNIGRRPDREGLTKSASRRRVAECCLIDIYAAVVPTVLAANDNGYKRCRPADGGIDKPAVKPKWMQA